MRDKNWYCFIVFISGCVVNCYEPSEIGDGTWYEPIVLKGKDPLKQKKCWMSLKAQEMFRTMEKIDSEYATARATAQSHFDATNFDDAMLETMLREGAIAYREIHKQRPHYAKISLGMNLGGLCMMKMPSSVLFFHRMKLRNDTIFRVNYLHNDIENMVLKGQLSLNTLHLTGAYDRSTTDKDPGALIYTPTFGELHISMEEVEYTIQGRYRLQIQETLVIELIVSTLEAKNILLTYGDANPSDPPIMLQKQHMGDFISRLKTDLDKWIQDYFNDCLVMTNIGDVPSISMLQKYDQQKAVQLTAFTDDALNMMNKKLNDIGGDSIRLPSFKILASHGVTIKINNGTLRGLNTMYRRSVPTTLLKQKNLRYVDTIIGFSDLKVTYQYEVKFPPRPRASPALTGLFIMSANELTAHLSLGLLNEPETMELDIDFINHMGNLRASLDICGIPSSDPDLVTLGVKSDSITVEGAAMRHIANFKHILQHEIATIMSNSVTYGVGLLKTLPRCEPFVAGMLKKKRKSEIVTIGTTPIDTSSENNISETKNDASSESMESNKIENATSSA